MATNPAREMLQDDATQKIAVVNLSDEDEDKAANSEQGGEPQATADYYRCDDDQEHILEWDPSAGRFVPQTTLRARYKAADDQQVESDMDTHCGDIASPGQGTEEDEK